MNNNQKTNIISHYNDLIDEIKKNNYENDFVKITYKGVYESIQLIDEDRADVFIVDAKKTGASFITCMWLFISDSFRNPINNGDIYPIKFKIELYNFENLSKPIAFQDYQNQELLDDNLLVSISKYLGLNGDLIYNNPGARLLIRFGALGNNIELYFKEFVTKQLESL